MSGIWWQQTGDGPDLVLIHGWGLHGGIWDDVLPGLSRHCRVTVVDLPGHGHSTLDAGGLSVSDVAGRLLDLVPSGAVWLGWSLGGLVALAAATRSDRVGGLILVATTPRFVTGTDWPHGMAPEALQEFADNLGVDYQGTLRRFLGLHAGAGAESRAIIRDLRARLFAHGQPSPAGLSAGLRWLGDTDLRASVAAIPVPVSLIHGDYDRLVPPSASAWLADQLPLARLHTIARAGHAPFLSHREEFQSEVLAAMRKGSLIDAG